MRTKRFFVVFALAAVLLAGVASYFASSSPDGLTRVADDHGISKAEEEHAAEGSPFADYGTEGVDNNALSGGLAGVIGVGVVLVVAGGLAFVVRRKSDRA
ncbi:MAG TPA: PDGLE domain-containing protein [Nocardioidaceae bacterium]|nr:PDGLE domain-containing protein [Nocardioidaceae bacterium]